MPLSPHTFASNNGEEGERQRERIDHMIEFLILKIVL